MIATGRAFQCLKFFLRTGALLSLATGCQTQNHVAKEFRASSQGQLTSSRTTVLFLVDGLSVPILSEAIGTDRVANISSYFQAPSGTLTLREETEHTAGGFAFHLGRASFPSLTYPNLASILTAKPVAKHEISGNRVVNSKGEVTNFEDFRTWDELKKLLGEKTVFWSLGKKQESSVSYSYPFSFTATAYQPKSFEAGLNYAEHDFTRIDQNTLDSLKSLLTETPVEYWPRFIFVHLIAIDGYAHHLGPMDQQVQKAVRKMDRQLKGVFKLLEKAEQNGRPIQALLTADHGVVPTRHFVTLATVLERLKRGVRLVTDNRIASVYLPNKWSAKVRVEAAKSFLDVPHVETVILKFDDRYQMYRTDGRNARIELTKAECGESSHAARFIWLDSASGRAPETSLARTANPDSSFNPQPFLCPSAYDLASVQNNGNYLLSSLVEYFELSGSPDIVILPDADSDFVGGYAGNHGGLTPEEIFVPVLGRGVHVSPGVQPTWRLLRDLGLF